MKSDLHAAPSVMNHAAEKFLNVSPVREVSSAPNSRSCSFKKAHRRPQGRAQDGEEEGGEGQGQEWDEGSEGQYRPRTNSLPSCCPGRRRRHASDGAGLERDSRGSAHRLCRVRSVCEGEGGEGEDGEDGDEGEGGEGDEDSDGSGLERDSRGSAHRLCRVRSVG